MALKSQDRIGVVIQPVDKPQAEPGRVAYDRVRHCSELLTDKFWLTRATNSRSKSSKKTSFNHGNPDDNDTDSRNQVTSQVDCLNQQQQGTPSVVVLCEEVNFWKNYFMAKESRKGSLI